MSHPLASDVNPLKTDPDLQALLKRLDKVNKYKTFQRWKTKFLDRLETFLYEKGMKPADKACHEFDALLKKFVKSAAKVWDHIEKGELQDGKKTVKAALALSEMCNSLTILNIEIDKVIPMKSSEEKLKGFNKFHLGATLIRQGFYQYVSMKQINDALTDIGTKLQTVADKQQHELFLQYTTTVQRFCDVMADLNLYEVMLKCVQFIEAPEEDESSEEEPVTITITINTHNNKVLTLILDPMDTIGNVKEAIVDGCGIVPAKQILQFNGANLDNPDSTLESCGIQDGSILSVEPITIPVTVRTLDGKTITIKIDPDDRLSDIKIQFEEETGIPARNQSIYKNGVELGDPNLTATEYGIVARTVLDVEPKTITVVIQTPDNGKSISIQVKPSNTANEIKERILEETGMQIPRQVLLFDGKELKDDTTLKSIGVKDGSQLNVEVFKVPVTVNTMDGKSIKINIDPTEYLSDIKRQLEDETGISAMNQTISMNGQVLADPNMTATEYGIQAGTILDMEPNIIKIVVSTPDGKAVTVEVKANDTAEIVKEKIAKNTGMTVPQQVLKYNGNVFANGKTIKEMGIQDGSKLTVEVFKVPATVNTMDGRSIKVMIDPTDRLSDIKVQLEDETGVPAKNQTIMMNGTELSDPDRTGIEYGITSGSVLDLEPTVIKINVSTPSGKTIIVDVKPTDTAETVKDKIGKQTGMTVPQQVLKHDGKVFANGKTVKDMNIQDGSNLTVEIFKVPITVNTMDGKSIKVMVDPTESIAKIKSQLENDTGVNAGNQTLYMNGQLLSDPNKTASEYGIGAGSVLDMEPSVIKINVSTPSGKTIIIDVKPSDTAEAVKDKIGKQTGMTVPQQVLKHDGKVFANGKTVKDMNIQDGSNLTVEIFKVPITVNTMDGKSLKVMVDPTESIAKIKSQLEKETGVNAGNQTLFMNGQLLSDPNKAAYEYGIGAGSVLDMEPTTITVNVTTPDGKTIKVDVKPKDTAEVVKGKIGNQTGMNVPQQKLTHNGTVFANGKTVKDMNIQDGSDITVEINKVPVTVKTMDGNTIQIMIDPTDQMAKIKKQIEKDTNVLAKNQKLLMNRQELADDNKTASDYGVKSGSLLELEPKVMKITAVLPDGRTYEIEVKPSNKIDDLKSKIAVASGMAVPRQVLNVNGKQLANGKTLKEFGLMDGNIVNVEIFKLPITINTPDGKTIAIGVEPNDTIDDIKKVLQKETGMEVQKQCLKLFGDELKGSSTATDCGIKAGSELVLTQRLDPVIFVDIKSGTLFAVDRDVVIAKAVLTPYQNNKLDFTEAAKDNAAKDRIGEAMKNCSNLGVSHQVVVTASDILEYNLEEAEKVKGVWGVSLKKREKNVKGEELLFIDPKTGSCGELSRQKYIDMKFITPVQQQSNGNKSETIAESEKDSLLYDKYISMIRGVFGIKFQ